MTKRNHIFFPIQLLMLLLPFLLGSCISDVDLEQQLNEKTKLVVYCRLCPQADTTYITLTHTQLLYTTHNQSIKPISNGMVEISCNKTDWVRAYYDEDLQRYFITKEELPIVEGGTYYLRASAEGFDDVSATCTVPHMRNIDLQFDLVEAQNDTHWGTTYGQLHTDFYWQWQDFPGEENYYAFFTREDYYGFSSFYSIVLERDNTSYEYISDEGQDGKLMRYLYEFDYYGTYGDDVNVISYDDDENDDEEEDELTVDDIWIMQLDRNCYLYETSQDEYGNEFSTFLLEPEQTYSNIKGGFGLFGAFVLSRPLKATRMDAPHSFKISRNFSKNRHNSKR